MPKPSTPLLQWSEEQQAYKLSTEGRSGEHFTVEDNSTWPQWLETHTSFAFQGREGRLSVIKETRPRGTGYWYAYRSSGQRTAKRYLGRASDVTFARLEETAGSFARTPRPLSGGKGKTELPTPPATSLLLTKLLPPRLPATLIARPRLLHQLDLARERKLTLLVAPAGFGKTTLISQWIQTHQSIGDPLPLAWLVLDSGDNDPVRFWRYVIAACRTFHKNLGQAALALLAEAMLSPLASPPLETALTLLLNDIAQQVQSGLLILDDYHAIEELRIHETLAFFLEHLPPNLSVLLISRAEPRELPLLRWRARGEISELQTGDLRFSSEETAEFLQQTFPAPLSDADLKQIDTLLQGWVAGLRLLALTKPGQMTARPFLQSLTSPGEQADFPVLYQPLLDYFVKEILDAQPGQVQFFLLQTSALSRLNNSLCAAVTGNENSAALLAAVEHAGLFLEALEGTEGWYRFHTLFTEALRREANKRLGEETLRALSLRASIWYKQHSMRSEAIEAALRAHAFEQAALMIEDMDLEGQTSETHTVHRWLALIPVAVLYAHPLLCWLASLALQAFQKEKPLSTEDNSHIETLLHMAEKGWRAQGNLEFLGLIAASHAIYSWQTGQFARAAEYARQALEQLPEKVNDRRVRIFHNTCLFVVGASSMYTGRFDEARLHFLAAHEGSLVTADRHFTNGMLLLAGACSYALGELYQAHEYHQQALISAREQADREIIAQALRNLAGISFEWNELALAEQQAREAQMLALESEEDLQSGLAFLLALLAHARRQITSAQQQAASLLARLQLATTPEAALRRSDVLLFSARLALETGDAQTAKQILATPALLEQPETSIFQTRILLANNQPEEACAQLERLLLTTQNRRQVGEIQVLLALAHAACQREHEARHRLRQALSQARVDGRVRLFLSEGDALARLLRLLVPTIQEPALRSYAQSILHTFARPLESYSAGAARENALIERLSPQERRVLRLLEEGKTNQQISQELVVSVNTVKDHLKHLYRKLGVSNRLQASEAARHLQQNGPL